MKLIHFNILKIATPFIGTVLFIILYITTNSFLEISDFPIDTNNKDDLKWRLFWGLSVIAFFISMIWSYCNSIKIILDFFYTKKTWLYITLYLASASMVIGTLIVIQRIEFNLGGRVGKDLLTNIVNKTRIDVDQATIMINALTLLVIVSLVISTSILAITLMKNTNNIRKISHDLQKSLYTSSILLAAGSTEIYCLYMWAANLKHTAPFYKDAAISLSITGSIFFTLILLVIYVPLFIKRNEILREYLSTQNFSTKEELDNWYAVNHLQEKSGASFNDIIAYILPIVTGIIIQELTN